MVDHHGIFRKNTIMEKYKSLDFWIFGFLKIVPYILITNKLLVHLIDPINCYFVPIYIYKFWSIQNK